MSTINISLPTQLKTQAHLLVEEGHYASFSDLMRTALRQMLEENHLNRLVREAKQEMKTGKGVMLRNKKDIKNFFDEITK